MGQAVLEVGANTYKRQNLLNRVDWTTQSWQVVEIPLDSLGVESSEAITSFTFSGTVKGTFYLDEVALVAASLPITAVLEDRTAPLPHNFTLAQNFPNPFNSQTVIRFALPTRGQVTLILYNLAGQKVATLVQGVREVGAYTLSWDGRDDQGKDLASGVYLCRLQAGAQIQTRKLVLVR